MRINRLFSAVFRNITVTNIELFNCQPPQETMQSSRPIKIGMVIEQVHTIAALLE